MSEAEMFQDAYVTNIKTLYATFSASLAQAGDDDAKQSEADARFRLGLINAKKVKGRALAILAGL